MFRQGQTKNGWVSLLNLNPYLKGDVVFAIEPLHNMSQYPLNSSFVLDTRNEWSPSICTLSNRHSSYLESLIYRSEGGYQGTIFQV
jgi:hypothetical protein